MSNRRSLARTLRLFWAKVYVCGPDECWPWLASVNRKCYGTFQFDGRKAIASRVAWILANGDPGSLAVCHRCDNPICVNPLHLFLGSQLDNVADRVTKGRNANRKGELNTAAKLKVADVLRLRCLHAKGVRNVTLASEFGLSPGGVSCIVRNITWRDLGMEGNAVAIGRAMQ